MSGSGAGIAGYQAAGQGGLPHHLQTHIGPLDGLRGLAAILVVFSHMGFVGIKSPFHSQVGNYGVFLFFVLSGFLMGHLYLVKDATTDRVKTYFAARISRIVPIYYIVIIASFLYGRYVDGGFTYAMSPFDLMRHLLFVGNVSVFWSIGPEFQFYFLFPLLWILTSMAPRKAVLWGVPITFLVLTIILFRSAWPGVIVLSKLHIFLAGIMLGILRPFIVDNMTSKSALIAQLLSTAVILVLLLPAQLVGPIIYPDNVGDAKNNRYYADLAKLLMLTFVVGSFSFQSGYARVVLENKVARMIGKYSFSVYLLNVPVLYAFQHSGLTAAMPQFVVIPLVLVAVVVVSGLSFRLLEDPTRIAARSALMRLLKVSARPARPVAASTGGR